MSMLSKWVARQVKKNGVRAILEKVGDMIVKTTKSKEDDKVWQQVKDFLRANIRK